MAIRFGRCAERLSGFAKRLASDAHGNTLLLMAASLLPITAAIGSGVDLTRAYMAQARLQQAVDSASLAGRKAMDGTDTATATGAVNKFMSFNFPDHLYSADTVQTALSTTSEGALVVHATSSVPTTLMKAFGIESIPIAAEARARRSGTNIDVVLVLDVTGSMADDVKGKTPTGSSPSKMSALQTATLNFLGALDSTRQQLAVSGLRVRVGIIPYSQTVNIGRYLKDENPANIVATSQDYVTQLIATPVKNSGTGNKWSNAVPVGGVSPTYNWTPPRTLNLTSFVTAGGSGGTAYSNAYAWKGCVEMRDTVTTITASSDKTLIPAGAWDIMDVAPGQTVNGQVAPAWRPYFSSPQWNDNRYGPPAASQVANYATTLPWATGSMYFTVKQNTAASYQYENAAPNPTATSTGAEVGPNSYCPAEVKLLSNETLQTKAQLTTYVNNLKPVGSTLHDVGMFWGLAMISPGAPFTNVDTYNQREVKRYIIFMTDGAMDPNEPTYSAYGVEDHELRTKTGQGDTTALHNKRFDMLCEYAKRQNINISTVAFGTAVTTPLQNCATTTEQAYLASSASELNSIFQQIAQNIGYLRLAQ